jgi:hypothetical protein
MVFNLARVASLSFVIVGSSGIRRQINSLLSSRDTPRGVGPESILPVVIFLQ